MNIVIVGAGKIGYYLAKTLKAYKHDVLVIETNKELCKKVANDMSILVTHGDGTDINILSETNIKEKDIFIAVTGKDENNLIACQLAKRIFGINRTIARVNNPKNIEIFERLGVDIPLSSTSLIAELIEQEVDYEGIKTLVKLKNDKIVLNEIFIGKNSIVCNKPLRELDLPRDCVLISVIRDEEVLIPNGYTVLREGDYVIMVSSTEDQQELKNYFIGKD